jgi:hypothetical protein
MANGRETQLIKRIRNEIIVALKIVYPAALRADCLLRSMIPLFPMMEFEHLRRDLHYLAEKGYLVRVLPAEGDNGLTPWRKRWFKLTAAGVELADRCVRDPALEE